MRPHALAYDRSYRPGARFSSRRRRCAIAILFRQPQHARAERSNATVALAVTSAGYARALARSRARHAGAQVPSVAPLSPPVPPVVSSGGGVPKQGSGSLALTPGSQGETAPSSPGGGGKTLSDCMGFWEPATHMSKAEWRAACQRTLNRIQ